MRMRHLSLAVALAGALAGHAFAQDLPGPASGYNVFIFGNGEFMSENTDTMGNLAAGGNVSLMNYSVASGIPGSPSQSPNPARLVVGGQLTASNGGVGSGGGSNPQDGTIYYQNAADVPSLTSFTANGGVVNQTLLNFNAAQTTYTSLSSYLESLAANTSYTTAGSTLTLNGSSNTLNVFSLTGSVLSGADTVNIDVPTGSTVLINVSGYTDSLQTGSVFENGNDTGPNGTPPAWASSVLYNFYQATSLALNNNPSGSVLAPDAGVTSGGTYANVDGQLVADSYDGTNEFENVAFDGSLPAPVPLPASGALLLSALGLCGGLAALRRHVLQAGDSPARA